MQWHPKKTEVEMGFREKEGGCQREREEEEKSEGGVRQICVALP